MGIWTPPGFTVHFINGNFFESLKPFKNIFKLSTLGCSLRKVFYSFTIA